MYDYDESFCYDRFDSTPTKMKVRHTHRWYDLSEKKPDDGRKIIGLDSGSNERELIFSRNMFWLPDMSMYVYFTPSKWRYV